LANGGLLREEDFAMKRRRFSEEQITFALRQAKSKILRDL
jgi:hypothetical protein